MNRFESRNKEYQQSIDIEAVLNKRDEFSVILRKNKRYQRTKKRRAGKKDIIETPISIEFKLAFPDVFKAESPKLILEYCMNILIGDHSREFKFDALKLSRMMLTREKNCEYLQDYLELGYFQFYLGLLEKASPKEVISEAS